MSEPNVIHWPTEEDEIVLLRQRVLELETQLSLYRRAEAIERILQRQVLSRRYERIMEAVCRVFDVRRPQIFSRERTQHVVDGRQTAMALFYEHGDLSSTEVGKIFDRDHGTVLNAVTAIKEKKGDALFATRLKMVRDIMAQAESE